MASKVIQDFAGVVKAERSDDDYKKVMSMQNFMLPLKGWKFIYYSICEHIIEYLEKNSDQFGSSLAMYESETWDKSQIVNVTKDRNQRIQITIFEELFAYKQPTDRFKLQRLAKRRLSLETSMEARLHTMQDFLGQARDRLLATADYSKVDGYLIAAKWIQPRVVRMQWLDEDREHPFINAAQIKSVYFPPLSDTPNGKFSSRLPFHQSLENTKLLIDHLKIVFKDIWKAEPTRFNSAMNNWVSEIAPVVSNGLTSSLYHQRNQEYSFSFMPCIDECVQVYQLWFDFLLDLSFDIFCKYHGEEAAKADFAIPVCFPTKFPILKFSFESHPQFSRISRKITTAVVQNIDSMITRFYETHMPNLRNALGPEKNEWNVAAAKAVSRQFRYATVTSLVSQSTMNGMLVLHEYFTTATDKHDSELWKISMSAFRNLDVTQILRAEGARLTDYASCESFRMGFTNVLIEDFSNPLLVQILEVHDAIQRFLWKFTPVNASGIDNSFYFSLAIAQLKAKDKQEFLSRRLRVECLSNAVKDFLDICPSVLSLDIVRNFLEEYDNAKYFDIIQTENSLQVPSRLFTGGILTQNVTGVVPKIYIPDFKQKNRFSTKHMKMVEDWCIQVLSDSKEPLKRKLKCAKWLGKGLCVTTVDEISKLYARFFLPVVSKEKPTESDPLLKRNLLTALLYCIDDYPAVIDQVLSAPILSDRDVNVFLIDGMVRFSHVVGEKFTQEFEKRLLSPGANLRKLGVAAMKSIIRLVTRVSDPIDILTKLWSHYEQYHDVVACSMLNALRGVLNDPYANKDLIWGALVKLVNRQGVQVDIKYNMLVALLCEGKPKSSTNEPEWVPYRSIGKQSIVVVATNKQETYPIEFKEKNVALRYFDTVLMPLVKAQYDPNNPLAERTRCIPLLALEDWIGLSKEANDLILSHMFKFINEVVIPIDPESNYQFLGEVFTDILKALARIILYHVELSRKMQPSRPDLDSISKVFKPIIASLLNSNTDTIEMNFSNMYKLEAILSLNGLESHVFDDVDEK